jgi:hypothetical protein
MYAVTAALEVVYTLRALSLARIANGAHYAPHRQG